MKSNQKSSLFVDLSEAAQASINGGASSSIRLSSRVVGNGSDSQFGAQIDGKNVSREEAKAFEDKIFGNQSFFSSYRGSSSFSTRFNRNFDF